MKQSCFQCGKDGSNLHGFVVCQSCKQGLRLFSEETILSHLNQYQEEGKSYAQEIQQKLDVVEKKYIKATIKLLDIQEKLNNL